MDRRLWPAWGYLLLGTLFGGVAWGLFWLLAVWFMGCSVLSCVGLLLKVLEGEKVASSPVRREPPWFADS